MRFSVLTLNLWNVSEPLAARYSALEAGLKVLRPDIVCLQEIVHDPRTRRRQSELVADMCGLAHAVDNEELSILSRTPLVRSHSTALPDVPDNAPRQILLAETLIGGRPLVVANTHLAWQLEMTAERKMQVEVLLPAIEVYDPANKARVLCGDFNDDPDSPALHAVLGSGIGFRDCYAEAGPNDPGLTWVRNNPYVHPSTTRDQRIDYIFAAGGLVPKDCSVVFDGSNGLGLASDHFGVFCNFSFR